ncbi:MAG: PilC/PilY family type IV pilus protein [Aeromonadaceae bacterium]
MKHHLKWLGLGTLLLGMSIHLPASELALPNAPLFVPGENIAPLVMLVMGRDHTLFYEAYNDTVDLDGDGKIDTRFKPSIRYAGYFDSSKCYSYNKGLFTHYAAATTGKCSGGSGTATGRWSGNFLNYLTMSRMDVLRQVLYGGKRLSDDVDNPTLIRSHIPQDAHSWGKTWDPAVMGASTEDKTQDRGLKASDYGDLEDNYVYFFANTSLGYDKPPLLRVLKTIQNPKSPLYIWNWVSKEQPVAGDSMDNYNGSVNDARTDYEVKVRVCVDKLLESNCKKYGNGKFAPTGLLQKYGEGASPSMKFGLITGSYAKNTSGGVLRARVGKMSKEISEITGQFKARNDRSDGPSIIRTLDALRVTEFNGSSYNCGWIKDGPISDGKCQSWGNPIAEMLYESLRYFAGAAAPSPEFTVGYESDPGLVEDTWADPYTETEKIQGKDVLLNEKCAQPVNLIISDAGTSYDSDQLPGSEFSDFAGSLPTNMSDLKVGNLTEQVSNEEGLDSQKFFIGEVKGQSDAGMPTAKTITNLSQIRGLAPLEPTKEGSYYSAGLAHFARHRDLNPIDGDQKPLTMAVAMASNLPEIQIKADGKSVTLVPFAKSIDNGSASDFYYNGGGFQPTNGIVDFYVESISETEGTFRVNFEDVEQGADHDMDMIVKYHYSVSGSTVTVTLSTEYASGTAVQHAGYVISGTTADGVYLDVRDSDGTQYAQGYTPAKPSMADHLFYMDTVGDKPRNKEPYVDCNKYANANNDRCKRLPMTRSRTFTVAATSSAASILRSPLWYAAKWGGYKDKNGGRAGIPDAGEWDKKISGTPDKYFLVTNAGQLGEQLKTAMEDLDDMTRSSSSVSYTASELTNDSQAFIATFEAKDWSGDLTAYPIVNGNMQATPNWKANQTIKSQSVASRVIFTMDNDGSKRVFSEPAALTGSNSGLSEAQITALLADYPAAAGNANKLPYVKALVNYLRGDTTYEAESSKVPGLGMAFRTRKGPLGDNVHSTPVYGVSAGDGKGFVIFGANDGMVHVLDASNGQELFAYIPSISYQNLSLLASQSYTHKYFVDGAIKVVDIPAGGSTKTIAVGTFGLGAQGAWALDLTNLTNLSSTQASANSHLLWELTDTDAAQIGYMPNAPAVFSAVNGDTNKWVAVFGNGYNSSESDGHADATGEGALLVVDLLTGSVEKTLKTGKKATNDPTGASRPNALTEPVVADADQDGVGDYLYAGDLFGNLWKVDISGDSIADWAFTTGTSGSAPKPLFTAVSREGTAQPITARPSVAHHPEGGLLVLVGTGKYVESSDISVTGQATQSIYGLWDKPERTTDITRDTLLAQTIVTQTTNLTTNKRVTSNNAINWSQHDGWYLDLYYGGTNSGERVNSRILITQTTASITSMIPSDDVCSGGGSGWYMEVDIYTGSNSDGLVEGSLDGLVANSMELERIPSEPIYNYYINGDGDAVAKKTIQIDGGTPKPTPPTLIKTGLASWQILY